MKTQAECWPVVVCRVLNEISNEITYNIFEGGKVGAADEMRIKRDHNCNKLHNLFG